MEVETPCGFFKQRKQKRRKIMRGILARYPVLLLLLPYVSGLLMGWAALNLWAFAASLLSIISSSRFSRTSPDASGRGLCDAPRALLPDPSPREMALLLVPILAAGTGSILKRDETPHHPLPRIVLFEGIVLDGPWQSTAFPGTRTVEMVHHNEQPRQGPAMKYRVIVSGRIVPGLEPGVELRFPAEASSRERRTRLKTRSQLIEVSAPSPGFYWRSTLYRLRQRLRAVLDRTLAPEAASLSSSVLLGIPSSIGSRTRNVFRKTGTLHLLAISGLHVGIIMLALSRFLGLLALSERKTAL